MGSEPPEFVALAFAARDRAAAASHLREAVSAALGAGSRVTRASEGVVVAVREGAGEDLREHAEAARRKVAASLQDEAVSVGLAGPRRSPQLVGLQAEQALLLGRALRGAGRVTVFDELGPYCFVLGQPAGDLRDFCDRVLGPLASDRGPHEDLVRTLEAYLRAHGSVNGVARALYLHRNTVRQRLRRIAALTGADLSNAESRLALHLAVLGRRALARLASSTEAP